MVSSAAARALTEIESRASDVMRAFTPGALPAHTDSVTEAQTQTTSNPLTIAAPKNAYFVVTDELGRHMYTRDGEFQIQNGAVVDRYHQPLLGFAKEGARLGALRIDSVDAALHRAKDVRIEVDGSVTYMRALIDPRTGEARNTRFNLGRLALARFPVGSELLQHDATRGLAPSGVAPHIGLPGDGNFEHVRTHVREGSRVNFADSIEKLREAYLAFDALRSAEAVQGKLEKTTLDLVK